MCVRVRLQVCQACWLLNGFHLAKRCQEGLPFTARWIPLSPDKDMPALTVLFSHPIFLESLEEAAFLQIISKKPSSNSPNRTHWSNEYPCSSCYLDGTRIGSLLSLAHLQICFGWVWNQQNIRTTCMLCSQCQLNNSQAQRLWSVSGQSHLLFANPPPCLPNSNRDAAGKKAPLQGNPN